jgi:hypothetical protein
MSTSTHKAKVLHPEVVLRSDGGAARPSANHVIRGAAEVAGRAQTFAHLAPFVRPVLVNGVPGVVVAPRASRSQCWPSPSRVARS